MPGVCLKIPCDAAVKSVQWLGPRDFPTLRNVVPD